MCSILSKSTFFFFFFFQAEDGIRDLIVTGVQTCALPISLRVGDDKPTISPRAVKRKTDNGKENDILGLDEERSEEHTSELQSRSDLVCRLLLEKKKTTPSPRLTCAGTKRTTRRPSSECGL